MRRFIRVTSVFGFHTGLNGGMPDDVETCVAG
jgi:hypothetical protein